MARIVVRFVAVSALGLRFLIGWRRFCTNNPRAKPPSHVETQIVLVIPIQTDVEKPTRKKEKKKTLPVVF